MGSKNRGSLPKEKPPFVSRSFLPWKIASGNDRPRGKDLGWNLCHSFPSDNFTVPPRTDATTFSQFHPFLFGKYEFLSLERKNYDEPLFFTSMFGGGRTKSYWIMLFFARKLSIEGGGILSRRLVNCCSMKKWRDKSFTGVRVSPSR